MLNMISLYKLPILLVVEKMISLKQLIQKTLFQVVFSINVKVLNGVKF